MSKKYVAYGAGFSGEYDSLEDAHNVIKANRGGDIYVRIDLATEHRLAADFLERERIPLNQLISTKGGAFFVHWTCHRCLPDNYEDSDSCEQCGKPRTDKSGSR